MFFFGSIDRDIHDGTLHMAYGVATGVWQNLRVRHRLGSDMN